MGGSRPPHGGLYEEDQGRRANHFCQKYQDNQASHSCKKKKKKIVSIHIEFVSVSIIVLVKSVCDSIPMELIFY